VIPPSAAGLDDALLLETMSTCRAMRRLRTDDVPDEMLRRLVECARYAPSGRNLQRGRWIVVREQTLRRSIADLHRRASEDMARSQAGHAAALPHHDADRQRRMWSAVLWQSEHLHELPVLMVACGILDDPDQDPNRYASSIWPGIQNLLLAARAMGLGATPTTFVMQYRAEFEALLELPPRVAAYALIPVGFPAGRFGPLSRLPVEQLLHLDRWTGPVPDPAE
jgi:nitroreductase